MAAWLLIDNTAMAADLFVGVITGIYSQGLVVELDNTAWLLIDDQQLPPPHSLRVGAIVCCKLSHPLSNFQSYIFPS